MSLPPKHPRRGFTLTELLVVIAIIAILASLGTVAVMRALSTARAAAIKVELDQIDAAMKRYKETYGSYPPCDLSFDQPDPAIKARKLATIRQHIAMAFPRYDVSNLEADLRLTGLDLKNFRPDQALYFFLRGFSPNPQFPFFDPLNRQIEKGIIPATPTIVKVTPFFDFDTARLGAVDGTGADQPITTHMASYFPPRSPLGTTGAPYLYWDYRAYGEQLPVPVGESRQPDPTLPGFYFNSTDTRKGSPGLAGGTKALFSTAGIATPYMHDKNGNSAYDPTLDEWVNPDTYQLIAPGNDRKFGSINVPASDPQSRRLYPTGINYDLETLADDDNATNCSSAARLGDDIP